MKRIFIKTKEEVSIGDMINLDGVNIEITEKFIEDNSSMFEVVEEYIMCTDSGRNDSHDSYYTSKQVCVEGVVYKVESTVSTRFGKTYRCLFPNKCAIRHTGADPSTKEAFDKQELLKEAIEKFPIWTKFKSELNGNVYVSATVPEWIKWNYSGINDGIIVKAEDNPHNSSSVLIWNDKTSNFAEVLKPLLTTEDGVDIYAGEEYYFVDKSHLDDEVNTNIIWNARSMSTSINFIRFSTRELAQAYIDANKEKTLKDYESELLENNEIFWHGPIGMGSCVKNVWLYLKKNEPKLYWLKVLELIALDLNGDWISDTSGVMSEYSIDLKKDGYVCDSWCSANTGKVRFKDSKTANKAIELMGDKLDYIYK